jgi:hypothetical protein
MAFPAPAIALSELRERLGVTLLTARDIRSLFYIPEFRAIQDRTTQMTFLRDWALEECLIHINAKTLGQVYGITEGNVRKILCKARKKAANSTLLGHHPTTLTQDQEQLLVQLIVQNAAQSKFMRKGEFLTEVEHLFGKVFTYQWVNGFLGRHAEQIVYTKISPQEDPRLQVPRPYLDHYIDLVKQHLVGVRSRLAYNIDETGSSDWEERKSFQGIVPTWMPEGSIHFSVTRKIKHQTMLVSINAAGEALCPLIVTSDPATKGVFRDGIEEDVDLKVHVGRSAYVDAEIFYCYISDVLIPTIRDYRQANGIPDASAVLLMDNCAAHLKPETVQLLSENLVKIITFPPHTSGIFQMLDLVFFGAFKQAKRRLHKDESVHVMEDHARRMFRAFETAGASDTVRGSFKHAGFNYSKHPEGYYTLEFDEDKVRRSGTFREVWEIDFPIERLTQRRQASQWGFINSEAFSE